MNVLVLNAGSSSLKFQLIATDLDRIREDQDERLCRGEIEHLGGDAAATLEKAIASIRGVGEVHAVGHRVVHGGELFSESAIVTDEVLQGIRECVELAPLHNPQNIEGIEAARKFFGPGVRQVAVFDTAFHHRMPEHAYIYALPYGLYERHRIRRYGFHGTSHRYVCHRYRMLRQLTREQTNVISLHLGNGCSAAAVRGGYSVDTSMGMTPLEGLVMGTRSGDVDASIVGFVAKHEGLPVEQVELLLNERSGLLGISGVSNDMRELMKSSSRKAALAIDVFCYRARKYIGAFLAAMGGADAVLFTGGIGENSPEVRARICDGLEWAGLTLDLDANQRAVGIETKISGRESKLAAYCIPTNEELLIARDTVRCVLGVPHPS